jgi:hypothetical protein
MNLLAKAKEGASTGVAGIGSLSSLGASSLGGLTSSAVSFGSAAVGHLQVGGRAAAATKLVKDLVLTPKSTLITGSLPSALVPDERVDYAIVLPPAHRGQEDDGDAYPLLLTLHGLKGSRDGLVKQHEHGDWELDSLQVRALRWWSLRFQAAIITTWTFTTNLLCGRRSSLRCIHRDLHVGFHMRYTQPTFT